MDMGTFESNIGITMILNGLINKKIMELFETNLSVTFSDEWVGIRTMKIKYFAEVLHTDLHEHKVFSAYDRGILNNKVNEYLNKLKGKYEAFCEKRTTNSIIQSVEERSDEAKDKLEELDNILLHTLSINDAVDWNKLKDRTRFKESNPKNNIQKELDKIKAPNPPVLKEIPTEPTQNDFIPKSSLLGLIFPSIKQKAIEKANDDFKYSYAIWESDKIKVEKFNNEEIDKHEELKKLYNNKIIEVENTFEKLEKEWEKRKEEFQRNQKKSNDAVDELKNKYENGDEEAIEEYCEIVLNTSVYPEEFPQTFRLFYNKEGKQLVVDYDLPPIDKLPKLKDVKFVSKEVREYYLTENQQSTNFDLTMYRICIRTIHELFEADVANHINIICFNGWVNAMDLSKGVRVNSCIMSIQTNKEEFTQINLSQIDVKACFKSLKGIGSSKLSGISAIQPIITIDKKDKRIVEHYNVADGIDSSTNLASMDWEDFENLIREVFEREFQSNGGEVRVTQASRDGGVDAIAFDPDPIRGGKIVIQAKRYTNTVGVSAVRDLFGTVNHEGATKGILVTTADYGPDAYEFAKGKPISLLSGANLLYLLQKHGYNAKIDIKEAKEIYKNSNQ
jgi:restriction system protein